MKEFLVIFREPDGRKDQHSPDEIRRHREDWQLFTAKYQKTSQLGPGMPLTLTGNLMRGADRSITTGPHTVGDEIVGGFQFIYADSLEEATLIMKECPIFNFGGYAEIREIMSPTLLAFPPNHPDANKP